MMTQGTRKQTTEPILGSAIQVTTATAVSHAFPWCVQFLSHIPGFVSIDLIGENNQVILEDIWVSISPSGNFREEDKSAKFTPTRKFPRLQYKSSKDIHPSKLEILQSKTALCNTHSCHTAYPGINNTQDFVFTRRRKQTPISIPRHGKYRVVMATDDIYRLRLLNIPEKALKIWQPELSERQHSSPAATICK